MDYKENQEYYEGLDKRTNEYKDYKKWKESQVTQEDLEKAHEENFTTGLGDVVEKVTKATGIKKVVEWIAGEDCGCDKRKKQWNKTRFKRNAPDCFNEEEYNFLTDFFNRHKGAAGVGRGDVERVVAIEERIWRKRRTGTVCGNCGEWTRIFNDVKEVYEKYNL